MTLCKTTLFYPSVLNLLLSVTRSNNLLLTRFGPLAPQGTHVDLI